jgi:hypothetical protein
MVKSAIEMIDAEKEEIISNYKMNWKRMISEWNSDNTEDAFWLMFSACYLFKTNNVRWALDPVSLLHRLSKTHTTNFIDDFNDLSFALISHLDADHFDRILINNLSNSNTKWIVPAAIAETFIEKTTLKPEKLVVVHPGEIIEIDGIAIRTYDGFHDTDSAAIASAAFYIDTGVHKMFFPGDTRRYEKSKLPEIPSLNYFFAHMWLGYEAALDHKHDLLVPFCDFCSAMKPETIIIAHLFEVARTNNSYWNVVHADKTKHIFKNKYPDIQITVPPLTKRIKL